jgi:glycosyltransferase involved in cell wall biosynthesis
MHKKATKPLVSICCITYNHANYIKDAINGFLNQQTNFPIEIIIHDDASTDGTANIVRTYQERYPQLIKSILQSENQYSTRGFGFFANVLAEAQGKYIALCEGDDYWTDESKLQKQVDYLESNHDYAICFHKVKLLEDGHFKADYITNVPASISTINDLAWGNYIHTCSCMFRNRGIKGIGPGFSESPLGDYYLHMMNAQSGKIFQIDSVMAVYRLHRDSVWSNSNYLDSVVKTLKARHCILADLSYTQSLARRNLVDGSIELALFLRKNCAGKETKGYIMSLNSEEYISRLLERLQDSTSKIEDANKKFVSIKFLFSRLVVALKSRASHLLDKYI